MRRLRYELRMLAAEVLLGWVWSIAPGEREGHRLRCTIGCYFKLRTEQA